MTLELTTQPLVSSVRKLDRTRVVAALLGVMALLKIGAVFLYERRGVTIFEPGFSFDPYVRALVEGRGYESCASWGCDHASRMPGVPFYLDLASFVTTDLRLAALIKVVLFSALVFMTCRNVGERLFSRSAKHDAFYLLIALFVAFSPNLLRHASAVPYEEGFLVELVAIAVLGALHVAGTKSDALRLADFLTPLAAAAIAYLFKSSMILMFVAVTAVLTYAAFTAGRRTLAGMLVALALIAPAGWATHNYVATGRASPMSSYDGENMFRGWNAHTLDIYPRCSLDMLFEEIRLCAGKTLDLPHEVGRADYADEWAWNDGFKKRAMDWIVANPKTALELLGVKAFNVLATVRIVPYSRTDGLKEKYHSLAEELIVGAWLMIGRLIELFAVCAGFWLLFTGDAPARRVAFATIMFMGAYATPYILGFGYERHFSILVMIGALASLFLFSHLARLRDAARA